jgi:hypothetical protein
VAFLGGGVGFTGDFRGFGSQLRVASAPERAWAGVASIKLSSAVRASVTMDSPMDIVRRVMVIIGNGWSGE